MRLVRDARDVELPHDRQHRPRARSHVRPKHTVPAPRARHLLHRTAKVVMTLEHSPDPFAPLALSVLLDLRVTATQRVRRRQVRPHLRGLLGRRREYACGHLLARGSCAHRGLSGVGVCSRKLPPTSKGLASSSPHATQPPDITPLRLVAMEPHPCGFGAQACSDCTALGLACVPPLEGEQGGVCGALDAGASPDGAPTCGPATCGGCCASGVCVSGTAPAECGSHGLALLSQVRVVRGGERTRIADESCG
jgi:hypothetical protein